MSVWHCCCCCRLLVFPRYLFGQSRLPLTFLRLLRAENPPFGVHKEEWFTSGSGVVHGGTRRKLTVRQLVALLSLSGPIT